MMMYDISSRESGKRAAERFISELNAISQADRGRDISDEIIENVRTTFIAAWVRALIYCEARKGHALDS